MICNSNKNRILAIVVLMTTLFVLFFSTIYINTHVNHHCNDTEHCPICTMIEQCQQVVRNIGLDFAIAATTFFFLIVTAKAVIYFNYQSVQTTLISQKVRLDS